MTVVALLLHIITETAIVLLSRITSSIARAVESLCSIYCCELIEAETSNAKTKAKLKNTHNTLHFYFKFNKLINKLSNLFLLIILLLIYKTLLNLTLLYHFYQILYVQTHTYFAQF